MTDSRLREFKRAWEASGSVEDEAAYLRERVRVGELTRERLELAAYLGHQGAHRTLGDAAPEQASLAPSDPPQDPRVDAAEWAIWSIGRRLAKYECMAVVRGALSVAELALPLLLARRPEERTHAAILEAAGDWCEHPCQARSDVVRALLESVGEVSTTWRDARLPAWAIQQAAQLTVEVPTGSGRLSPRLSRRCLAGALLAGVEPDAILTALQTTLVPWALEAGPAD